MSSSKGTSYFLPNRPRIASSDGEVSPATAPNGPKNAAISGSKFSTRTPRAVCRLQLAQFQAIVLLICLPLGTLTVEGKHGLGYKQNCETDLPFQH